MHEIEHGTRHDMTQDEYSSGAIARRLEILLAGARLETPDPYAEPPAPRVARRERTVNGGRVVVIPSPDGWVRIAGLGPNDQLLAEFSCPEEDFSEAHVRRMERHVVKKCGVPIALVG